MSQINLKNLNNDKSKSFLRILSGVKFTNEDGEPFSNILFIPAKTIVCISNGYIDNDYFEIDGFSDAVIYEHGYEHWKGGRLLSVHHRIDQDHIDEIIEKHFSSNDYNPYEEFWSYKLEKKSDYDDPCKWKDGTLAEAWEDIFTLEDLEYYQNEEPEFEKLMWALDNNISLDELSKKEEITFYNIETIEEALSFRSNLSFQDRLRAIMKIKKKKNTDVYKEVHMSEKTFNKILNGKPEDSISSDNAIMVAYSLELSFEEMVKFMNFAGKGFRNFSERDKIIKYFFDNKIYDIDKLNIALAINHQKIFFDTDYKKDLKKKVKKKVFG